MTVHVHSHWRTHLTINSASLHTCTQIKQLIGSVCPLSLHTYNDSLMAVMKMPVHLLMQSSVLGYTKRLWHCMWPAITAHSQLLSACQSSSWWQDHQKSDCVCSFCGRGVINKWSMLTCVRWPSQSLSTDYIHVTGCLKDLYLFALHADIRLHSSITCKHNYTGMTLLVLQCMCVCSMSASDVNTPDKVHQWQHHHCKYHEQAYCQANHESNTEAVSCKVRHHCSLVCVCTWRACTMQPRPISHAGTHSHISGLNCHRMIDFTQGIRIGFNQYVARCDLWVFQLATSWKIYVLLRISWKKWIPPRMPWVVQDMSFNVQATRATYNHLLVTSYNYASYTHTTQF